MIKKILSIDGVVSILFIISLSLPLVVSIIKEDQQISDSEKRKLAVFPELTWSSEFIEKFPKEFETYYDDHFGFRASIVRMHNYLLLRAFRVSPTPLVVVGSGNWYFLNADSSIADFIGRFKYSDTSLERFSILLEDRIKWLDSIDSHYIYLPVPNKETVYAEHLPLRIRNHRAPTKYDQIVGYLEKKGLPQVLDSQKILLERKQTERVFLQTDSHWNHDGTYLVYQELIKRLQQWLPDLKPLPQKYEKEWFQDFSGDLSILMNLRGLITEVAPKASIVEGCEPIPGRVLTNLKKDPFYADMPSHRLPVVTGCEDKKYKAVVIHDSFGKYLRPYLNQHFKRVVYINYMNFEKARRLIEKEKPDVVIDQRAARNIQRSLRPDPDLEKYILATVFQKSTPLMASIEGSEWQEHLLETTAVHIAESGNSMTAVFTADKSKLALQLDLEGSENKPAAVKLTVDSFQDSVLAFCYEQEGEGALRESQCSQRSLAQGSGDILFRIIDPAPQGRLTVISQKPGKIIFQKLLAKSEADSGI